MMLAMGGAGAPLPPATASWRENLLRTSQIVAVQGSLYTMATHPSATTLMTLMADNGV